MHRIMRTRTGQSALELLLYGGFAAAAITGMAFYVNRAYQGYLYSSASSHGPQFDYANNQWRLTQQLNSFDQGQKIEMTSSSSGPGVDMPSGNDDLPTVPGGRVQGRRLETTSDVSMSWDVRRKAHYEAQ